MLTTLVYINLFVVSVLFVSKFSLRLILGVVFVIIALFYSTMFSQSLFYSGVPKTLWFKIYILNDYYLKFWYEGVEYGLLMSLRMAAPLILSFLIYTTTSVDQFLKAFHSLKLPFEIRFMLTTAIRFIPIFVDDYKTIRKVQLLKGYAFSLFKPFNSIATEIRLVQPVFFHALRNAQTVSESVIGRGYHPNMEAKKTSIVLSTIEKLYIYSTFLLFIFVTVVKFLFFLYVNDLFYHSSLRFLFELNRTLL